MSRWWQDRRWVTGRKDWLFLTLVLAAHFWALGQALATQRYLIDDSIQYLTLSENLFSSGQFSQSYLNPFVPDVQRTPGYPAFLGVLGNAPWLVLFLQHALVILSGWLLFRLLALRFGPGWGRLGSFAWLAQPYPIVLASFVLSEVLFIACFLAGLWAWMAFRQRGAWQMGALAVLGLAVAAYVRPIGLPVLGLLVVAEGTVAIRKRQWEILAGSVLLPILLVGPWMLRNQAVSGRWTFSSMGEMGLVHGRLGGMAAWKSGAGVDENVLYRMGDSLAAEVLGFQNLRTYYCEKQNHETELFREGMLGWTVKAHLQDPVAAVGSQLSNLLGMLKGVAFGWTLRLSGKTWVAWIVAGLQGILNVVMYLGVLGALFKFRSWRKEDGVILGVVIAMFLISMAAWADGRYRMVMDPLLVYFVPIFARKFA